MLRILLLILALLAISSTALAQTTEETQSPPVDISPTPEKVSEVEQATDAHFAAVLDSFLNGELKKDKTVDGYIINYGSDREIAETVALIKKLISLRKYDSARVVLISGGFRQGKKTEFWLVRPGVMPPEIEWRPHRIDSFGRITQSDFDKRFANYLSRLRESPTNTGYIIIDGPADYFAEYQKLVLESTRRRESAFEPRLLMVRGKTKGKPETQLWLLPNDPNGNGIERFKKEILEYVNEP